MNQRVIHGIAPIVAAAAALVACDGRTLATGRPESRRWAPLGTREPLVPLFLAARQAPSPEISPSPGTSLPAGHPQGLAPSLPPGHPPLKGGTLPRTAEPAKESEGLTWRAPAGWVAETPQSGMRKAQYRVPGPGGDAECVVFYFGPGQGGDAMANAARWAAQFQDSGPSSLKTREEAVGGLSVLLVEVGGTYVGGMGGTNSAAQKGYMLMGAIAKGPDANWFFKLIGPEATINAERVHFEELVRSLKKGD